MKSVELEFHGPLAWVRADDASFIFDVEISKNPGIYLWTVETPKGHLVWYVGQTRTSFHQRMKEHFKEQMSGSYDLNDPVLAQLATIVRGADTDRNDLAPEAAGLLAIMLGNSIVGKIDHDVMRLGFPIYDALYARLKLAGDETHGWQPMTA